MTDKIPGDCEPDIKVRPVGNKVQSGELKDLTEGDHKIRTRSEGNYQVKHNAMQCQSLW